MTKEIVTQGRLQELFDYDPESGFLIRRIRTACCTHIGDIAGHRDTHGYVSIGIDNTVYKAHRLIWVYVNGSPPKGQIDHINQKRSDNRIANLRDVTTIENGQNRKLGSNNSSGMVGVTWNKQKNKWTVGICVDKNNLHLGYFADKNDAFKARAEANIKYGFHENHGKQHGPS